MNKLKLTLLCILLFSVSVCMSYAITIESRSAVYLGETLEIKVNIPPRGAGVVYLALPQHSELIQWILHYEDVVYDYEVVGVTTVHKWTFLEENQDTLNLNARVDFNRRGEYKYIVYAENGEDFMTEREIIVLDRALEEEEKKTFELPKIPPWLIILSVFVLVVVLTVAFIKIKHWY